MDHMFEKVEALYPKAMRTGDDYFWGASDYEPLLQSIGRILVRWDDSDYQGSTVAVMERSGQYGVLIFGWGSCSGCDALQACESYKDIADLRRSLFDSIQWGTAEDTIAWMGNHDWAGDWLGRHFPPTFVDVARQALRGERPTDEAIYVEGVEDEPYAPWQPEPGDVPNGDYGMTRRLTDEELAKLPDYDFGQSGSSDKTTQEG